MTDHIIVLPGGGYRRHADHEGEPVAAWLQSLGFETSILLYPVESRHPAPLEAVQAEVRRVRSLGVSRVGVIGFSAGGHLAGHSALTAAPGSPERLDFAILGYPVGSMLEFVHEGSRDILIGADASDELRAATSLERIVTADAPPFFLWHTASDASVPVQNSYLLASSLAGAHVPHELHVFPHGAHGLGLAPDDPVVSQWTGLCARWLDELRTVQ
jgi:acetyl esterase/lipase